MNIVIEARSWDELKQLAREIIGDSAQATGMNEKGTIYAKAMTSVESGAPVTFITNSEEEDDNGTPQPVIAGELDATGLPWDERIHAGTQTKTAQGVWKKRKGVQEPLVQEVEAELRSRNLNSVQSAAGNAIAQFPNTTGQVDNPFAMFGQPVAITHTVQNVIHPDGQIMAQAVQVDPRVIQPTNTTQNFNPNPAPVQDFQSLMNTMQGLFGTGAINPDYLNDLNQRLGVSAMPDIQNDPALISQAYQLLRQDGKIQ